MFKSDLVDSKERQDRILIASIAGVASRHARTRRLSGPARAAAVAELAELAAGRSDLLARHAGMTVGMIREGDTDEDRHLLAAELCIEAGADTSTIQRWIDAGRRRAAEIAAMRRPSSLLAACPSWCSCTATNSHPSAPKRFISCRVV